MPDRALVYVVDDDPGIRDAMRCLMATVDLDVACYASATQFLEASITPALGCVLLDKIRSALELARARQALRNQHASIRTRLDLLTPREKQVLDGVVDGLANKQIAYCLGISSKTVELHRSSVMAKMHVRSVAELVRTRMQVDSRFSAIAQS